MIIDLALTAIFIIAVSAGVRQGFWRGMLLFLSVLAAASLATAWYERVAACADPFLPGYTLVIDVAALWLLFGLIVLMMHGIALLITPSKIRFPKWIDLAGSVIVAVLTGWTIVEFAATTLHTAPLRADAVATPEKSFVYRLRPDQRWLLWVRGSTTNGPFAQGTISFDPQKNFIERYARRRGPAAGQQPAIPVAQ
ncbi:MAG: CvpA family protein [Planctomycetota bacterium]